MLITSSKLLTLQQGMNPIDNGAIFIDHGIIRAVGPAGFDNQETSFPSVYSFKDAVLMPGLVNLHTHLELPPLFDRIQAKEFPDWVLNLIQEKKTLKPSDYVAATAQNLETAIETGTTTIGEICTQNISQLKLKDSGLRAVVFQEIICMIPEDSCTPLTCGPFVPLH